VALIAEVVARGSAEFHNQLHSERTWELVRKPYRAPGHEFPCMM
jgi:hypothetical protein